MTARQSTGLKWAIIATFISGFSVFLNALVVKGIDPLVHTTIKNSVAGIMVLGLILLGGARRQIRTLKRTDWLKLITIAIIGGSIPFYLFFTGLKEIGAVQGQLIQKSLVVWVALLAIPLLREKLSVKLGMGVGLLYLSSLITGVGAITGVGWGQWLVLGATWLWALESIVAKKALKQLSPNLVVGGRMVLGSMVLAAWLISQNRVPLMLGLSLSQWLMLVGLGVLLFGYVMSWYRALKDLPAMVVAGILVGATVVNNILSAILIEHTYTLINLAQAVMVVVGVIAVIMGAKLWPKVKTRKISSLSV